MRKGVKILYRIFYTGEDLKWDTPHRGVFQIVTDIRPFTN